MSIKTELTNAIDENAGQNEVEYIKHGSAPQFDVISDIDVRFRTTRIINHMSFGSVTFQFEFPVCLVVALISGVIQNRHI